MTKCIACNQENAPGRAFCEFCGAKLIGPAPPSGEDTVPHPAHRVVPNTGPVIRIKHLSGVRASAEDVFGLHEHDMLTLGRDPYSHIAFDSERDDSVSRRHAAIAVDRRRDDTFELIDLGSTNGVFVNGQRLSGKGKIKHGDVIRVGMEGPEIRFLLDPPPPADMDETRIVSAQERALLLDALRQPHVPQNRTDETVIAQKPSTPLSRRDENAAKPVRPLESAVQGDAARLWWQRVKNPAVLIIAALVVMAIVALVMLWRDQSPARPPPTAYAGPEEAAKAYRRGDYATAFKEFKALAEKGDPDAATMVGALYAEGRGTPRDYGQALQWSTKAADRGNARAQYNVGFMYENGMGVPENFAQAASWYEKAAANGDIDAISSLGLLYIAGQGVRKDVGKGLSLMQRAADQGDAKAQSKLGVMLINGTDVPVDKAAGFGWLQKAAAQGDPVAQFDLGAAYERGDGTRKNPTEAVSWYEKAAQQGYASAQYNLGLMIAKGAGTAPDLPRAYMWLTLAADQGDAEAKAKRDYLASKLSAAQMTEGQRLAAEWKPKTESK